MVCDRRLDSLAHVRACIAGHCGGRLDEATIDDVQLVASEFVTNALEHGFPGVVSIDVVIEGSSATVTVTSTGDSRQVPELKRWSLPDPTQRTGRGLALTRLIARSVEVHETFAIAGGREWIAITAHVGPLQ